MAIDRQVLYKRLTAELIKTQEAVKINEEICLRLTQRHRDLDTCKDLLFLLLLDNSCSSSATIYDPIYLHLFYTEAGKDGGPVYGPFTQAEIQAAVSELLRVKLLSLFPAGLPEVGLG